jgi:hypothetical protein
VTGPPPRPPLGKDLPALVAEAFRPDPPPSRSTMVGRTYFERGRPVVVLARWAGRTQRNVLIRRADGTLVVRGFRGLRLPPDS